MVKVLYGKETSRQAGTEGQRTTRRDFSFYGYQGRVREDSPKGQSSRLDTLGVFAASSPRRPAMNNENAIKDVLVGSIEKATQEAAKGLETVLIEKADEFVRAKAKPKSKRRRENGQGRLFRAGNSWFLQYWHVVPIDGVNVSKNRSAPS
jgi:hypothetical protein